MISRALQRATALLQASSTSARLDAELLLAHILGLDRGQLRARGERPLDSAESDAYTALLERRARGEPLAYLLGHREFWSLELEVNESVLVPRPETELLVEIALECLAGWPGARVLDLGTGSGAIGLAVAHERADARVDLVDSSEAALATAEVNRRRLGLDNVRVRAGSWYRAVGADRYALILANPPYLGEADPHLAAAELRHEPRAALVAGPDGLEALRAIAAGAPEHLEPQGTLVMEHGAEQGAATRALLAAAGLEAVLTRRDLAGRERATLGTHPG